jgi:hypothetical protein
LPTNRLSYLDLGRLKILQEVVPLRVFVPFAVRYMQQPFKLYFLRAGLCILGAFSSFLAKSVMTYLASNKRIALPELARMHEHAFVLAPLAEIAPNLVIPGHGAVASLLAGLGDQRIERLKAA